MSPYIIEVSPITDPATFWDFVSANKGEVTSVTFEFIAPNMFGIKDDWKEEMKSLKETEKVQRTKITLESSEGLELDTERVKAAVNYATRGTGEIRAKTKRKKKFNSKNKVKKATVPVIKEDNETMFDLLKRAASSIFGS